MKNLFLLFAFIFSAAFSVAQTRIYVSVTGNDAAKGDRKSPLKTIQAAVSTVQDRETDVEVVVLPGNYYLDKTIEITDSSFHGRSLTILAAEPGTVSVRGGMKLSPAMARKVTDREVRNRLQPQVRDSVRVIDLGRSAVGLADLRPSGFGRPSLAAWSELFVDGEPLTLARWPNDSMALIGPIIVSGNDEDKKAGRLPVFKYNTDRPRNWANAKNVWIGGYFGHGYADDMIPVKRIHPEDSTLYAGAFTTYQFMTGASFRQWFALNLPEEIDRKGEYVIDVENRKFYFYPKNPAIASIDLSVLSEPLVAIERTGNVVINGVTFESSRGMGVFMAGTENVLIENCTFRNLGNVAVCMGYGTLATPNVAVKPHAAEAGGGSAVRLVGDVMGRLYEDVIYDRQGGKNNGVRNCYIYNVGAGGVNMSGGNRVTLDRGGNFVENCKISNYNRIEKSYRPGVWMDGVGNRVTRCDLFDAPSMAILFHGNEQVIEYCKINNVCTEVDDQGAIYYGRDVSERGNVIRYNYFRELSPKHRVTATYHDDGACGSEVYGNIYLRAGSLPVLIGGGHDHHYHHNLFIDVPCGIHIDNRMQGWGTSMVARGGIIDQRLQAVKYDRPPYSTAYPELLGYWNENPAYPKRNRIDGNLFYKVTRLQSGESRWAEWWNNWVTDQDPGFIDIENPLKGFKADAEIFRKIAGFPELPFDRIGSTLK